MLATVVGVKVLEAQEITVYICMFSYIKAHLAKHEI